MGDILEKVGDLLGKVQSMAKSMPGGLCSLCLKTQCTLPPKSHLLRRLR